MSLRVGSLFTGYGGLDIAVGGELAWYAEIEPAACQVLAHHYPNVPNLGNITKIDWSQVEPVDVITGGYPCQPFSHAGNRKGKNDVRHLWPNVLDAIRAIRPRYAILENVSGHLTLGFADVLADLAEIGWSCEWGTYRASDVGAPHRRERLFIIAHANSGRRYQDVIQSSHFSTAHGEGESSVIDGHRANTDVAFRLFAADTHGAGLQGTTPLRWHDTGNGWTQSGGVVSATGSTPDTNNARDTHGAESERSQHGAIESTGGGFTADTAVTFRGESALQGTRQGESRGHPRIVWGKYAPAIRRWESVLDRAAPAPTTPGRNDRPRLNPQFVEWMMGLPDGWVTGHGLSAAKELKMLGNGVVPQQAHAAITQLLERTQP